MTTSSMVTEMAMTRGSALMCAERWDEAAQTFLEAVEASGQDSLGVASRSDAYRKAGIARMHQSRWAQSEQAFESAYALARELGDERRMALALNALGATAFERGEWQAARTHYARAQTRAIAAGGKRLLAQIRNNQGALWAGLDRPADAEACFRDVIACFEQIGDTINAARAWSNLGITLAAQERWRDAEEAYRNAEQISKQTADRTLVSQILLNQADLALAMGRESDARSLAERSLVFARHATATAVEAGALRTLADIARRSGDHRTAGRHLVEALDLCSNAEIPLTEAEVWLEWGHLQMAMDSPERALKAWRHARSLFAGLGNKSAADRVGALVLQGASST